jgi:serine protease Do
MSNMKDGFWKKTAQYTLAVAGGGLIVAGSHNLIDQQVRAKDDVKGPVRVEVDATPVQRGQQQIVTSFADVVKKISPSVVKVYVTGKAPQLGGENNPFFEDPLFRRFFGQPHGMRPAPMPRQEGLGSGVIVSKDGYILTNNHVVENAEKVRVVVGDEGEEFDAKVVGTDPKTDIAVIKIESKGKSFEPAVAGDSDKIQVGDVTLAVGNPFGIGQTVTMGIVSATGRASLGMEYEDFIQTDAAINPGNSGGALVDAQGRLIGINTAIMSRSGGNHGIGFAVPINLARSAMESLIEHGRVVRGFMGVNIQDVDPALAEQFDLKKSDGAVVTDVTPGSPAEKAGLKSGDVIVAFNGKDVRDSRLLKLQVAQTPPSQKVPVKIWRDGKEKELTVTLKEFPQDQLAKSGKKSGDANTEDVLDGVTVGDLDRNMRQQFNIPAKVEGAVVLEVDPESPSYRAGLREGMVIQEINRKPVKDASEAVELSEQAKGKTALLKIWSNGGSHFIVVKEHNLG